MRMKRGEHGWEEMIELPGKEAHEGKAPVGPMRMKRGEHGWEELGHQEDDSTG